MKPEYRTGSSREALTAARRTQLNRGLSLVLGVFAVYALTTCLAPALMAVRVAGNLRVAELLAAALVPVIAVGVLRHDRHARRHVEPLAQRVVTRGPNRNGASFPGQAVPAAAGTPSPATTGSFDAFDSSRAFAGPAAAPRTAASDSRTAGAVSRTVGTVPRTTGLTSRTARTTSRTARASS